MTRIMIQNGEAFIWIFGFALKSVVVVVTKLTDSNLKTRCERETLMAWVTRLVY